MVILLLSAWAGGTVGGTGLGVEVDVNDPFQDLVSLRLDQHFTPSRWTELSLSGAVSPAVWLEDGNDLPGWTDRAEELLTELHVSPDISHPTWRFTATGAVIPFQRTVRRFTTRVGVGCGLGVVHTSDDLLALQAEGEARAETSAEQWRAGPVLTLFGEVRGAHGGVRIQLEDLRYLETVNSTTIESKRYLMLGVEGAVWY